MELTVTKANALLAYKKGGKEERALLENLYGKEHFSQNVMERVKTYEDACAELGLDPKEELPYQNPKDKRQKVVNAKAKLDIIAEALQEGFTPDFMDTNQKKWYPWFIGKGSGFGFSAADYDYDGTNSFVGSRLCFANEKTAEYFGTQFLDLHNISLTK